LQRVRLRRPIPTEPPACLHARSAAAPAAPALGCAEDATVALADDVGSAEAPAAGGARAPSAAAWMGGLPYNPVLLERFRQTAALEGRTRRCAVSGCAARARCHRRCRRAAAPRAGSRPRAG